MSTDSRAPDGADRGAGGKLVRRRHRGLEAATPYRRPEGDRRGWLSGLVTGAGRLFSALFLSRGVGEAESSGSEGEDSEGDDDVRDGHGDNQVETRLELIEDRRVDGEPLTSKSPSKLVIEQLIQKESFTWDECSRLIDIIQCRVIDSPMPKSRAAGTPKGIPSSSFYSKSVHSGSFLEQVQSPEHYDKAVIEAKKWVEEKRSEIGSKSAQIIGACTVNKDQYSCDYEKDKGSPVDMAKSYMQALPPWSSPTVTAGVVIPSPRTRAGKVESPRPPSNPPLSSLEDLKRKYDSMDLFDNRDKTRSIHKETSENTACAPCFTQSETINKMSDNANLSVAAGVLPSSMTESAVYVTSLPETTANIPAELAKSAVFLSDVNAGKTGFTLNNGVCKGAGIADSGNPVSSSEDVSPMNVGLESTLSALPSETEIQIEVVSSQKQILASEKDQDLIHDDAPEDGILNSLHRDQKDLVEDFLNAEPISVVPENDNPTLPGGIGQNVVMADAGNSDTPGGSVKENLKQEDDSHSHSSAVPVATNSEARPSHVELVSQKEIIGSASTTTTDAVYSIPSSSSTGPKATSEPFPATGGIQINRPTTSGNESKKNLGKGKKRGRPSSKTVLDSIPVRRSTRTVNSPSTEPKATPEPSPATGGIQINSPTATGPKATPESSPSTVGIQINSPTAAGNGAKDGNKSKNRGKVKKRGRPSSKTALDSSPVRRSTRTSSIGSSPSQEKKL